MPARPPDDPLEGLDPARLLDVASGPLLGEWLPPSVEELAGTIPGCQPHEAIGRGGMGAVYRALQPALQRQVALKILNPDTEDGDIPGRLFQQEIQSLAALQHPNIVTIHEAGTTTAGLRYLIMEWVPGESLGSTLLRGPVSPERALQLIGQACAGLSYAHRRGIIHRDIKPTNLLVTPDGHLKIADFGLATPLHATPGCLAAGTDDYAAPESTADPRADLYSLGVTAYQLLTGKLPRGRYLPPSKACPELPGVYDDILLRALAPQPERRYSDADAFREALERPRLGARTLRRRTRLAAVFGALASIATAAVIVAWTQTREANRQREAEIAQREEAAKLINYLTNELMWRFKQEGDLARFDPLLARLDAYFTRFDRPDADPDFIYHLATFTQVRASHAAQLGRLPEAERHFRQLLQVRDRHLAAAPASDTARASRADSRLRFGRWLASVGRHAEAAENLAEALHLTRSPAPLPDGQGVRLIHCGALRFKAALDLKSGDPEAARRAIEEADALLRQLESLLPGYPSFVNERRAIESARARIPAPSAVPEK